jgi:hypothetical protein
MDSQGEVEGNGVAGRAKTALSTFASISSIIRACNPKRNTTQLEAHEVYGTNNQLSDRPDLQVVHCLLSYHNWYKINQGTPRANSRHNEHCGCL